MFFCRSISHTKTTVTACGCTLADGNIQTRCPATATSGTSAMEVLELDAAQEVMGMQEAVVAVEVVEAVEVVAVVEDAAVVVDVADVEDRLDHHHPDEPWRSRLDRSRSWMSSITQILRGTKRKQLPEIDNLGRLLASF